jgi:hypothetical protein
MQLDNQEVVQRYMALSEQEKEVIRNFLKSPAAIPLAKLLGIPAAQFKELAQMARPARTGLARRPV